MKRALYPIIAMMVMFVTLGVGYVLGLVAVSDQPAATPYILADEDAPTTAYGPGTIEAPANFDALLENKASTDPILAWLRINPSGTPYLQWRAIYGIVTPTPKPSATPDGYTLTPTAAISETPRTVTTTPTTTRTPTSTVVATSTPTSTPSATATKRPTKTATPTATGTDDEPTPTAETNTLEPITPGPEKQCLVRNLSNGPFNIRADHVNDATITGQVPNAEYAAVDRIFVISTGIDEWFHVAHTRSNGVVIRGWMHWTADAGLIFGADDTLDLCWDVPIEGGSATYTPVPTLAGPTATPLPEIPFGCTVINNSASNLNMRSGPGTNYSIIGSLKIGEYGQAIQSYTNGEELWLNFSRLSTGGQNVYAWVAKFIPSQGNLASLQGDCSKLPEMVGVKVGWHLTQGARWEPLASTAADYGITKSTDLTKGVSQTVKQVNPNALWVHRSIFGSGGAVNCPTFEWTSPGVWVERFRYTWPTGSQYIETINECSTGPGGATFNNFIIETTRYANSLGFCLLNFSFAAGTPDYPEWSALVPVLRFLDANPCKVVNGKPIYNGIALHGAFCSGPGMMSNEWTRETHICDRHMYIRDELLKATGYDLYNFKGPIVYTEFGTDAGYGGTSAEPTWPTDKWLEVVSYTLDLYEREGLVDAIILWNLGDGGAGQWISREYWIEPLAALLRSRALQ